MKKLLIILGFFIVLMIVCVTQFSFFVIQPIGAIPEGKTLVIVKLDKMNFIDSADAMCEREMGAVSLFCRMGALSAVTKNSNILFRLPYSEFLYKISTNAKKYEK